MKIAIVAATPEHIPAIANRVRPADRLEIADMYGQEPLQALEQSLHGSELAWTGMINDVPVCMFGVVPVSILGGLGRPWMIGTELLDKHPLVFLRRCGICVDAMLKEFPSLENFVDARNVRAVEWLKWIGFTLHEPETMKGLQVIRFEMRAENNQLTVPLVDIREKVAVLEQQMMTMPQVAMQPVHHFADGLYGRELFIPANTLIVGKVHKRGHLNFLVRGEITVWTEEGMKRLTAPWILKSAAGIKRVGLTHTDTVWVTVHATDAVEGCDVDALENELAAPTMNDYDDWIAGQEIREIPL